MPNQKIDKIKKIIEQRNISSLYHFTTIENLNEILDIGLWSRKSLQQSNQDFKFTDESRLDGKLNHISLSISFPNNKMLYLKRNKFPQEKWCVIEISTDILWEEQCLFFPINAASNTVRRQPTVKFSSAEALGRMFSELNPNSAFPTDVQAEVMVKEHISLEQIKSISVNKINDLSPIFGEFESNMNYSYKEISLKQNPILFGYRPYNTNYSIGA